MAYKNTGSIALSHYPTPVRAASMLATSIRRIVMMASIARFAAEAIRIGQSRNQCARCDLPGETPAVLAPPALAFAAAIVNDRIPIPIGFRLIICHDLKTLTASFWAESEDRPFRPMKAWPRTVNSTIKGLPATPVRII